MATETPKTTLPPALTPGRWHLDLYIVGLKVVGKIYQMVGTPPAPWAAKGMKESWMDTDLGQHPKFADAKKAVEVWYRTQNRIPCTAHSTFRAGCVMCEKSK